MKSVKIGIVGCGIIGRLHAAAAAQDPDIDLVALADLDQARARALAEEFDVPDVYSSGRALIDRGEVDAVVLALITGQRSRVACHALRHEKHVLLEKPPALNAAQIRRYMSLQGDRVVGCCSARLSFLDGARAAREIVARGELGEIRVVRCRGISAIGPVNEGWTPPAWRVSHKLNGGGFLVNWGVYDLDYLMHVTDWQLEPETVLAQAWPIAEPYAAGRVHPASDAENHVILHIRCRNGAVIVLERGEAVAMQDENCWQVTGEHASLHLQMTGTGDAPTVILDRADPATGLTTETVLENPGVDVQHQMPIRDFAAAIREGRQPQTDLQKALRIQQILDAVYRSARSGRAVRV